MFIHELKSQHDATCKLQVASCNHRPSIAWQRFSLAFMALPWPISNSQLILHCNM